MARNLTRNTKVYISNQSVFATCDSSNTWEVKVLDGYSFSQPTTTEDIQISEAGTSPIRGQKTFNVSQDPVEVSMSTYMRPYDNSASLIDAPERILWASLAGRLATVTDGNGDMITTTPGNGNPIEQRASGSAANASDGMKIDFEESDSNELGKLTIWFHLENITYRVDNVNISTAEIDFAIDSIAMISWSGMGTSLNEIVAADHTTMSAWTGGTGGANDFRAVPATTSTSFLRNKLSTITLENNNVSSVTLYSSTSTGGSTTTLEDSGQTFIADAIVVAGDYIRNTANGETAVIASFTETEITIEGVWTAPSSDAYVIIDSLLNAGQTYTLAITGGTLTVENNMEFLTPEELGVVNQPLTGFANSRGITGNITAYLNTGFYGTSALLQDLLEDINNVTNSYNFLLSMGGTGTAVKRVDLALATAQLSVPAVNVEDVIATEITFSGQGSAGALENQDELVVYYHSD